MRYLKTYQRFEAVATPEPTDKELEKILAEIAKEEKLDPKKVVDDAQALAKESPKVNEEIIGVGVGLLMIAGVVGLLGAGIGAVVRGEFKSHAMSAATKEITELQKNPEFKGNPKKLIKAAYEKLMADEEFRKKYDNEQAKYGGGPGGAGGVVGG